MRWRTVGLLLGLSLVISVPALAANYVVKVGPPGGSGRYSNASDCFELLCLAWPRLHHAVDRRKLRDQTAFHSGLQRDHKGHGHGQDVHRSLRTTARIADDSRVGVTCPLSGPNSSSLRTETFPSRTWPSGLPPQWQPRSGLTTHEARFHELVCVLRVTGESANLSLNRVKIEGGFVEGELAPWGRLNTDYAVAAEPWNWPGPLVGTMSIKGSVFLNVNIAIGAYYLGSSNVTIGGSPSTGNLFEDVEVPITLVQLDGSSSEISYNNIIRTNWLGIELNQAPLEPTQTASRFVVEHNDITVVPTYAIDSGWLSDAIDILDWNWDDPTSVKSEFVVSDNTIQLSHGTGSGIVLIQDAGSIISNNQISGTGFAALYA